MKANRQSITERLMSVRDLSVEAVVRVVVRHQPAPARPRPTSTRYVAERSKASCSGCFGRLSAACCSCNPARSRSSAASGPASGRLRHGPTGTAGRGVPGQRRRVVRKLVGAAPHHVLDVAADDDDARVLEPVDVAGDDSAGHEGPGAGPRAWPGTQPRPIQLAGRQRLRVEQHVVPAGRLSRSQQPGQHGRRHGDLAHHVSLGTAPPTGHRPRASEHHVTRPSGQRLIPD